MSEGLLDLAVEAAQAAGALLRQRFSEPARGVTTKSTSTDPVSDADRDAERLLSETILSRRPDDRILGEEGGSAGGSGGLRWVVDPLDGTVNFLYGIPHWSVSVAVEDDEGVVVGVVHDPNRDETFTAVRGQGTRCDGRPVRVTEVSELAQALVATGFAYDAHLRGVQGHRAAAVLPVVRDIRRMGSAAIDLAWVAAGRYDGYFEQVMGPWDKAAGVLLVEEAGGRTCEFRAPTGDDHGVITAGPGIFDALRELVSPSVEPPSKG